ncbi:glutamine amidotransferase [Novispirillum itersonii]|uniref:GMP synthase (Glutamine-hydrolyzing) n=1 Tax=Novispirillum itersonii TaxID=189 RepID=A0A7W9ZFB4_NOVIT|nr:glutamine amidotransferase [Novispirillum itersonii]MBB6210428.1 GMP synthase (glutamine-hydrolyzing) [Novispirillum itersonii]
MLKTAVAIRHVGFEDLGTFAPVLAAAGYTVHYYDAGVDDLWTLDPVKTPLLIVLGGPVGVGDTAAYPVLAEEIALLRTRIQAGAPTLGICLGAQLMAAALGARVAPTGRKEIGFSALTLTDAGRYGPLRHLDGVPVLHWHGDMFDIPDGAVRLASTPLCANQAFAAGKNTLGLQFHPEADATRLEHWLIGHAAELAAAGIDPRDLREQAGWRGAALRQAGQAMLKEWLEGLDP